MKYLKNPDIVIQDGENLDREDRLRDREPSDDELKRGLRERIIRHVISELEGEELDEVVLEGITQSQAHVIQDESTIGSKKVAFSAFVKVVSSLPQQSKIDQLIGNQQCIVESMKKMHLGKREKGNKEGACKFQTLNGRYFLKKNHIYGADMTSVEGSIFIKRGSIVSLDNCKHKKFMITVVWKANGSNKNSKYFPSRDTPLWEKKKRHKNSRNTD